MAVTNESNCCVVLFRILAENDFVQWIVGGEWCFYTNWVANKEGLTMNATVRHFSSGNYNGKCQKW